MEALVLAGGFGTRLQQVVPNLPKAMAPIGDQPFLEILLTHLARKGFSRVVLSLGYMAQKVVSYFGNHHAGMELAYQIEKSPLGTGGAVREALSCCRSDHIFVFNGDTFLDLEVADVEMHWQAHRAPIIVAREVPDTSRYGHLEVAQGRILSFSEKGMVGPGLINAGCYVLPANIFAGFMLKQAFSLEEDFLSKVIGTRRFDLFVTRGYCIDIGVPEDYERAQTELRKFDH